VLNLRYPGQYYDAESGLSNWGFRSYEAATGRSAQSDPMGLFGGQPSTYAYVGSNPLRYIDPLGLQMVPVEPPIDPAAMGAEEAAGKVAADEVVAAEAAQVRWVNPDDPSTEPPSPKGNVCPTKSSQLEHIFRNAPGHLPNTPQNQQLLTDMVNNPANFRGPGKNGLQWYGAIQPDGTQLWGSVRNGVIQNGGLNLTPQPSNPGTGFSRGN
jgi:RHS repeat-associated protein